MTDTPTLKTMAELIAIAQQCALELSADLEKGPLWYTGGRETQRRYQHRWIRDLADSLKKIEERHIGEKVANNRRREALKIAAGIIIKMQHCRPDENHIDQMVQALINQAAAQLAKTGAAK